MPSELSMAISKKLLECRKNHKLTQLFVAEKIGVSENTYAHYEKGRAEPSVDTLYTLCELYNESIDEWLGLSKLNIIKENIPTITGEEQEIIIAMRDKKISIERLRKIIDLIENQG